MKLHEIKKGTRAVKTVPLRLATAPLLDAGADWETADDGGTVMVGIRILTGTETAEAFEKAQDSARKAGVPQWLATHPLCQLHEMAQLVAAACVDDAARGEPFFVGGAAEVLGDIAIGTDNIGYLAQQIELWQNEVSPRGSEVSEERLISAIVQEAERPEHAPEAFFSRLRPKEQLSCIRSMARMLSDLLANRSLIFSESSSSSSTTTESSSPEAPTPEAAPTATRGKKSRRSRP